MNLNKKHAIGFLVALLCILTIGVAIVIHPHLSHKLIVQCWTAFSLIGGAVTISYLYPITTGPPTGSQVTNMVIATVVGSAAGDTSAVITHNFGLAAGEITQGFPRVVIEGQDGNSITSPWFELSENPNYTVLGKGTVAAGGTVKVTIDRPHSIVR